MPTETNWTIRWVRCRRAAATSRRPATFRQKIRRPKKTRRRRWRASGHRLSSRRRVKRRRRQPTPKICFRNCPIFEFASYNSFHPLSIDFFFLFFFFIKTRPNINRWFVYFESPRQAFLVWKHIRKKSSGSMGDYTATRVSSRLFLLQQKKNIFYTLATLR